MGKETNENEPDFKKIYEHDLKQSFKSRLLFTLEDMKAIYEEAHGAGYFDESLNFEGYIKEKFPNIKL